MKRFATFAYVALLAVVHAKHPLEDPSCTEPDRTMPDLEGEIKLRQLQQQGLNYDKAMFEIEEGNGEGLRSGVDVPFRVLFKVPVHTCRIKLMPGVREWVTMHPEQFAVPIEVAPYSQPPNFNVISEDNRLLMKAVVRDDATVADINNFLEAHGIVKKPEFKPAVDAGSSGSQPAQIPVQTDGEVQDIRAQAADVSRSLSESDEPLGVDL